MVYMEGTVTRVNLQAVLFDIVIVAMEQEMNVLSALGQFPAIIAANGTCSYNSVFHILKMLK